MSKYTYKCQEGHVIKAKLEMRGNRIIATLPEKYIDCGIATARGLRKVFEEDLKVEI